VALLVIDMINDFEFPGGDQILPFVEQAVQSIASLKARARREAVPVV
jgi:nicotinamidase-related amidase